MIVSTKRMSAVLAVGMTMVGVASEATAEVRWKLHAAFTSGTPVIGAPPNRLAEMVGRMSNGDFDIKVFEPGAIVSGTQYFDAVSDGSLDAAFGNPGYNVGVNPAYAFFGSVPFGPSTGEYLAWMLYGDGQELARELYARDNIHFVLCGITAPETAGWFREEINSPEDLEGLKMRFFGLGAKVMETLGVSTQLLAGGDIYPALELGTIDAAEFSMPAIDISKGFYQVASHNYFPGWHQQSTLSELLINLESWNALDDSQQAMIEAACDSNTVAMFAEGEAVQSAAMLDSQEKGAVIHRWSDEMLDVFQSGWDQVIEEEIAENEDSARIWANLSAFREEYKIWGDHAYLD